MMYVALLYTAISFPEYYKEKKRVCVGKYIKHLYSVLIRNGYLATRDRYLNTCR